MALKREGCDTFLKLNLSDLPILVVHLDLPLLSVLGLPCSLEFQLILEVLDNQVDQGDQFSPRQMYIDTPLDNLKRPQRVTPSRHKCVMLA